MYCVNCKIYFLVKDIIDISLNMIKFHFTQDYFEKNIKHNNEIIKMAVLDYQLNVLQYLIKTIFCLLGRM